MPHDNVNVCYCQKTTCCLYTTLFFLLQKSYPFFFVLFILSTRIRLCVFCVPCLAFHVHAIAFFFILCRVLCHIAIPYRRALSAYYLPPHFMRTCRRASAATSFTVLSSCVHSSAQHSSLCSLSTLLSCHAHRGATATTFQPRQGHIRIVCVSTLDHFIYYEPKTVFFIIVIIIFSLPLNVRSISCYFNVL